MKEGIYLGENFRSIPFEKNGLIKNEFRQVVPKKTCAGKQLRINLKESLLMGFYDIEEAYKRYPLPAYLK